MKTEEALRIILDMAEWWYDDNRPPSGTGSNLSDTDRYIDIWRRRRTALEVVEDLLVRGSLDD